MQVDCLPQLGCCLLSVTPPQRTAPRLAGGSPAKLPPSPAASACMPVQQVFDALPLAAQLNGSVFLCHGGISPHLKRPQDINEIRRPLVRAVVYWRRRLPPR